MDVKEQRIFSPDKIFTASKASWRNLWSFVVLAKILVGAKNRFANQTKFRAVRIGHSGSAEYANSKIIIFRNELFEDCDDMQVIYSDSLTLFAYTTRKHWRV